MRKTKLLTLSLVALSCLGLSSCSNKRLEGTSLEANVINDNYRTFYEIFVGGFSDSNNDGMGDLRGIINRFDYLNDGDLNSGESLGINGIWLMPIMPSPSYHKYDVANYKAIDKKYGTMEDFDELSKLCNERDVKLIIDLVLNHSSTQHPWFKECVNSIKKGDLNNKYVNYYTIVTKEEAKKSSGHVYYQIGNTDYYYEGNFSDQMPELNYDNEDVKNEIKDIIKFWIDKGVDGFRLDAVKYIYYHEDKKTIDFLKWFREECEKLDPTCYIVGEDWSNDSHIHDYYEAINCFDFSFSEQSGQIGSVLSNVSSVSEFTNYTEYYLNEIKNKNSTAILHPFLSNHDMDRIGGFMSIDSGRAFIGANMYLLSPGSPFIYYGEEICMKGSRGNADTDANRRLAMLWGDKDTVKDPIGTTYKKELQVNGTVKSQEKDKNSLLNHYKKLVQIRNAYPEIARGDYKSIETNMNYFGGFTSTYNNSIIGVFHNTSTTELKIDLSKYTDIKFSELKTFAGLNEAKFENGILVIGGQTSVILK